jgi:hypothetical protein
MMRFFILDASLAGLAEAILIGYMIVVTLVEAIVMIFFKFNSFGKCLLDSFLVNLASLGAGYVVSSLGFNINLGGESYLSLLAGFLISVIIEGLLLQLLNKKHPASKVWQVAAVMNLVTYFAFLLIFFAYGK